MLEESQVYAEHAGRETVELDDVKLAVEAKLGGVHATRGHGEMHEYAASVNRAPMPPLTNRPGIHMPQDDNLLSANYQFFPRYRAAGRSRERVDKPVDGGSEAPPRARARARRSNRRRWRRTRVWGSGSGVGRERNDDRLTRRDPRYLYLMLKDGA